MRNYPTKVYDYIDKNTGSHIVKAITMYANEFISAIAKCDPNDEFDLELGKTIALTRLNIKVAKKRKANMKMWAKSCKEHLEYLETEKRRVKKALEYAECSATDRKVEIKKLEAALSEITK